jgi:hypothetical protein
VNLTSGSTLWYKQTICIGGFNCSTSDQRLKKNISPLIGAMDQLLKLKGVTFEWKKLEQPNQKAGTQTGFIAQEVEKVFPDWVVENEKTGMKGIMPSPLQLAALQVESFREQQAEIVDLKKRLEALEANRRPLISGLTAEGTLFGVGFVTMAGAFVVTHRKRSESQG